MRLNVRKDNARGDSDGTVAAEFAEFICNPHFFKYARPAKRRGSDR